MVDESDHEDEKQHKITHKIPGIHVPTSERRQVSVTSNIKSDHDDESESESESESDEEKKNLKK